MTNFDVGVKVINLNTLEPVLDRDRGNWFSQC